MKIKDLELLDLNELGFDKNLLSFDSTVVYAGFVNYEASIQNIKEAIAFGIDNLRVIDDKLYGDFNLVNGKATELLVWIDDFTVSPTISYDVDLDVDENKVISSKIISFVAYPN